MRGFIIIILFSLISCTRHNLSRQLYECSEKTDTSLDRIEILNKMATILNEEIGDDRVSVRKGHTLGFSIFDINDAANIEEYANECNNFQLSHLYHFSADRISKSYSCFALIKDEDIQYFRSVNCKNKGNLLSEVEQAVTDYFVGEERDTLLSRLSRYRDFGRYYAKDNYDTKLECDCDPCR